MISCDPPGHTGDQGSSVDRRIAAVAHRQRGYITFAQLLACGLSPSGIIHRAARGQLIRVHRGVYAVGHLPPTPVDRACAAVLACGPRAALSHASALSLWGLARRWKEPFEVTAPTCHRRPGITLHRTRLTRGDVRRHHEIPVTTPALALLEVAPRLSDRVLARTLDDGRLAGLIHPAGLAQLLDRFFNHPGASRLRALALEDAAPTRSEFERAFMKFAARYELPRPELNARVNGYEVDAWFPVQRVIVELDGYRFHRGRRAFERDRERDAHQLEAGIVTVRITWGRMTTQPAAEARRLQTILNGR